MSLIDCLFLTLANATICVALPKAISLLKFKKNSATV
jgi:hypothetical protein